jgi:hypothetical protein
MTSHKHDMPVITEDEDGNLVFHEGSTEMNDDWIKVLEARKNHPERQAYLDVKRALLNASKSGNPPNLKGAGNG